MYSLQDTRRRNVAGGLACHLLSASSRSITNCVDASLIHEAAIGKIAGDQLTKLMTLGLTAAEAEEQIVNGFLK